MNKISLIIKKEYLSRVKKKSFIIMTFLTPLLFAGIYGLIGFFTYKGIKDWHNKVAVVSTNKTLQGKLTSNDNIEYVYLNKPLEEAKKMLNADYDYLLYIPEFSLANPKGIELFGAKQAALVINQHISNNLEELIRTQKLKESGLSQSILDNLKTTVYIATKKIDQTGQEKDISANINTGIAMAAGVLMFMLIMIYGTQVMRGVIEEKTSRVIEIIISSVKPFQLMMGKIIGVALVGLTQFLLWIVLTITISGITISAFVDKGNLSKITAEQTNHTPFNKANKQAVETIENPFADIQNNLAGLDLIQIISVFIFYFLGGYLFYSALYAAIGSAVDSETETQQFMMPVMMPLLFGYALSLSVVTTDPYGNIAFWLSMIPFTSSIAMVVRLPYGVPGWELAVSMAALILGFIGTVWVASRIYRVGILMYGKKNTFKEMIKWFTYKG